MERDVVRVEILPAPAPALEFHADEVRSEIHPLSGVKGRLNESLAPALRAGPDGTRKLGLDANESAALSQRELSVINGLAQGLVYKQIADELGVSIHTVRNYIRRIYEKLHVQSRTEAVAKYFLK